MLKMFHNLAVSGGSVAFWEQTWRSGDYTQSARYCDVDPLQSLLTLLCGPGFGQCLREDADVPRT